MSSERIVQVILVVQVVSAFFFVAEIVGPLLGLPIAPFNWRVHEAIEIGAALGLFIGVIFVARELRRARTRTVEAEAAIKLARSAFRDVIKERFDHWDLTPAERDVAIFAIKGFSTKEIAGFRGVSEGTIKAQSASIYRKAGVPRRPQFVSLFVDDLIDTKEDGGFGYEEQSR